MASPSAVTYSPPDLTGISAAHLKKYYAWRNKMDWLLAPIHTRANLKHYLKETAGTGSPLDALSPGARQRLISDIHFGPHGAAVDYFGDLQYLSTQQVYRILALFGEQNLALEFTGGRIRRASPQADRHSVHASVISKRFDKFWQATQRTTDESRKQRSQRVAQAYGHLFASKQNSHFVKRVDNADLRLLFRAATLAAFYTSDAQYAQQAEMDFAELGKRHFAGPPDYEQMYKTLVQTRQFSAVYEFYRKHPHSGLKPFPAYRDEAETATPDTPTMLIVSTAKDELIRRPVNLDKPAQIVILSDPHCHFCAEFDSALESRPKLRKVLEQHALWLTPPGSELEFATLQQWNKTHPQQQLNIMYSLEGWPMVKVLAIPQFFFLRHGKVVKHIPGWYKDTLSEIESDLVAIGLDE